MATDRPRMGVPEQRIRALREVELFEGLGLDALSELGELMIEEEFGPGGVLADGEQPVTCLWVLSSGVLAVGPESTHTLARGGVAGEWALLAESRVPMVLKCVQSAQVLRLPLAAWEELCFRRRDIHLEVLLNFVRAVSQQRNNPAQGEDAPPLFPGVATSPRT